MDVHTLVELGGWLDKAGTVGVLLVAAFVLAVGAQRGWWVPGNQFKKTEKTCQRWEELAMSLLTSADKAAALADFFRAGDR